MNLPTNKQNHGYIGILDFRGEIIRAYQDEGFVFHSEVCIWKDPVVAMQRTKALGLLHKTVCKRLKHEPPRYSRLFGSHAQARNNEKPIDGCIDPLRWRPAASLL